MTTFQHVYWGYEITYPDFWIHQQSDDTDVFVATPDTLDPGYMEPDAGVLQIRGEWNWSDQEIEPLWKEHIVKLAGLLGAKNVGSAPWRIGEASGMEAEIVLPKKDNHRLWTGILARDFRVFHFMVIHPKEVRDQFEPEATKIISSLRYPDHIASTNLTPEGLPIPPNSDPMDPQNVLEDIAEPQAWRAYAVSAGVGALQSFYLRELLFNNWQIDEYIPYPSESGLGFARYHISREKRRLSLGLLPSPVPEAEQGKNRSHIVYKLLGE